MISLYNCYYSRIIGDSNGSTMSWKNVHLSKRCCGERGTHPMGKYCSKDNTMPSFLLCHAHKVKKPPISHAHVAILGRYCYG